MEGSPPTAVAAGGAAATTQPKPHAKRARSDSVSGRGPRRHGGPPPPPPPATERTFGSKPTCAFDKFKRGKANSTKAIGDRKLKGTLERSEAQFKAAATSAARADVLLTEEAG